MRARRYFTAIVPTLWLIAAGMAPIPATAETRWPLLSIQDIQPCRKQFEVLKKDLTTWAGHQLQQAEEHDRDNWIESINNIRSRDAVLQYYEGVRGDGQGYGLFRSEGDVGGESDYDSHKSVLEEPRPDSSDVDLRLSMFRDQPWYDARHCVARVYMAKFEAMNKGTSSTAKAGEKTPGSADEKAPGSGGSLIHINEITGERETLPEVVMERALGTGCVTGQLRRVGIKKHGETTLGEGEWSLKNSCAEPQMVRTAIKTFTNLSSFFHMKMSDVAWKDRYPACSTAQKSLIPPGMACNRISEFFIPGLSTLTVYDDHINLVRADFDNERIHLLRVVSCNASTEGMWPLLFVSPNTDFEFEWREVACVPTTVPYPSRNWW